MEKRDIEKRERIIVDGISFDIDTKRLVPGSELFKIVGSTGEDGLVPVQNNDGVIARITPERASTFTSNRFRFVKDCTSLGPVAVREPKSKTT